MTSEINVNFISNLTNNPVIPQNVVKLSESFVPDVLKLNDLVFVKKLLEVDGDNFLLFSDKGNFTLNKEFVPKAFESGKILVNKIKNDFILKFISEIKEEFKNIDFEKISSKFTDVKFDLKNLFKVLDFNLKGERLSKKISDIISKNHDFKADIEKTLKQLFSSKDFSKSLFREVQEKLSVNHVEKEGVSKSETKEASKKLREVLRLVKKSSLAVKDIKVRGVKDLSSVKETKEFNITKESLKTLVKEQVKKLDYNQLTKALRDLNLAVKDGEVNLKSVLAEVVKKLPKEGSLLKFNEVNFDKPSKGSLDSFNLLKNILNLPTKENLDVNLDTQVKEFFKKFEALSFEKEEKNIKSFKREVLDRGKEGSVFKDKPEQIIKNAVKQLNNFEQIINGQEVLDRLNPILAAKGEPILLLFPNLFRNFMSSIEVSYLPYFENEIRNKNNKARDKNKYTHLSAKLEFNKLGKVEVRIKYNSVNLFAEIVVSNQKVAMLIENKIGKLKRRLRSVVKLNMYTKVSVGNYSNDYSELVESDLSA